MKYPERLRANRQRIDADLPAARRRDLSPVFHAQHAAIVPLLRRYVRGAAIDLGCGMMPFRDVVLDQVTAYDSFDREARTAGVTYLGDIEDMHMIPDARYDAALCLEVLEHVPHPGRALHEMARILRPGGWLVLSVPHLSRLHEEPHDYFRFTVHGLRVLLEEAGFTVESIVPRGGLLSFVGHQVSTVLVASTWHVPVLRRITWWLNTWFVTRPCYAIDRLIDQGGLFAVGYAVAAYKPGAGETAAGEGAHP